MHDNLRNAMARYADLLRSRRRITSMARWSISCLLDVARSWSYLLEGRAGKLLEKGKPFVVVAHDEPYFGTVYNLIRSHEIENGTWSEDDEKRFRLLVPTEEQPAQRATAGRGPVPPLDSLTRPGGAARGDAPPAGNHDSENTQTT